MNVRTTVRVVKPDSVELTVSAVLPAEYLFPTVEDALGCELDEDEVQTVLDAAVAHLAAHGAEALLRNGVGDAFDGAFDEACDAVVDVMRGSSAASGAPSAPLDENGQNALIKAHVLDDDAMRSLGFTDRSAGSWYLCRGVGHGVTFNVRIDKETSAVRIDVLDEAFMQPYDYQAILSRDPFHSFARGVRDSVEDEMARLADAGVLSGWSRGDYI